MSGLYPVNGLQSAKREGRAVEKVLPSSLNHSQPINSSEKDHVTQSGTLVSKQLWSVCPMILLRYGEARFTYVEGSIIR